MSANKIIRLTTEQELEALHVETFINTVQGRVTKVTDHSATRALIRGNVRTSKKALKDIALAISHLFVDSAYGSALDDVADERGIAPRLTAAQSSVWVRLVGDTGTIYQAGVHTVSDNKGNVFDLQDDLTIDSKGYGYVKVRSQQSGSSTNCDPHTIINISPQPGGHIGVINEYRAVGGRDVEDDDVLRQRIKEGPDILARGTLSYLTQAFIKINPNVLRVIYGGVSSTGKVTLSIMTVNGMDLTDQELSSLLEGASSYLSLTELNPIGTTSYGVLLNNVEYYLIDIEMRLELFGGYDISSVAKEIQQRFSKHVDFRFWDSSKSKVEWDDLLSIVKNIDGVRYVADQYFVPSVDIIIPANQFPRFRGFVAYDLDGDVLLNQSGTIDPTFFPNDQDASLNETVL